MRKTITLALALLLTPVAPVLAGEAGDAVFAERGPWTLGTSQMVWTQTVQGPEAEGFVPVEGGTITLSQITDPSDGKPALQMDHKTDKFDRKIGPFPVSGGDPVLTFFLERVARDTAAQTGGSPFYIRNRMKDALFQGGTLTRDGDTVQARFNPFDGDPNAERMKGFETLELVFTIGGPKAPIRELLAQTAGDTPGYLNRLVME